MSAFFSRLLSKLTRRSASEVGAHLIIEPSSYCKQEWQPEFIASNFLHSAFSLDEATRLELFGKFSALPEDGLCLDVDAINENAIKLIEIGDYQNANRLLHAASLIIDQYHSKIHYRHSYIALQLAKKTSKAAQKEYLEQALFQHPFNIEAKALINQEKCHEEYPLTPKYQGEFILGITCPIGWKPNAEGIILDAIGRGNYALKPERLEPVSPLLRGYYQFLAAGKASSGNNYPEFLLEDYSGNVASATEEQLIEVTRLHQLYHQQAAITYSNLGQALMLAGQHEAAYGALTKALDLDSKLDAANKAKSATSPQ